jgi:hypothetical protein
MAYSKAKLKSSGDKASCFTPFWVGKLSELLWQPQILHIYFIP